MVNVLNRSSRIRQITGPLALLSILLLSLPCLSQTGSDNGERLVRDTAGNPVGYHRLVVTPHYVDMDGKRIVDLQEITLSEKDTMPMWLLRLPKGQTTVKTASSLTVVEALYADSVRCFKVATLQFSSGSFTPYFIDSVLRALKEQVRDTADWNALRLHRMDCQPNKKPTRGNLQGNTGWIEEGILSEVLEKSIITHQPGDIFTIEVPGPDENMIYIVYKSHQEQYFRRNHLIAADISAGQ